MSYKGIKLDINPSELIIKKQRNTVSHFILFKGEQLEDLGRNADKITCVIASDKVDNESLKKLEGLCEQGGAGLLCLPNEYPFYAHLVELTKIYSASPSIIKYRLEFVAEVRGDVAIDEY